MLKKTQLEKYNKITGFNLWQIERDYLQHLFLFFLSKYIKDEIVFKGGTALQKIYGLNRFSIDLDFTLNKGFNIKNIFEKISNNLSEFGYKSNFKEIKSNNSHNITLKIDGPLYDESEISKAKLIIEISMREKIQLPILIKEIVPVYEDIQPYLIASLQEEEILAEKIRTILTRAKARDAYDLWFLLKRGIKFDLKLTNEKLKYYKLIFNKEKFILSLNNLNKIWKELDILLPNVPDFREVSEYIIKEIN